MMRVLFILSVSALIIAALYVGMAPERNTQAPADSSTADTGKALIGGDFTLVDTAGNTVTNDSLKGKPRLVYFGFTYCPDICPAGLLLMTTALKQLQPELQARTPQPVFITIDPARDTSEHLAGYIANFPGVLGLTGTAEQVKQAASAYRVYYRKAENKDGSDYLMDHSSYIYLMDEQGNYLTHFSHQATVDEMISGLRKALSKSSPANLSSH